MRNVLITGGSHGIGRACVKEFAKDENTRVIFTCKTSIDEAKALCEETGAVSYQVDQADETAVEELARDIHNRYGRISVLVNNAGASGGQRLFTDLTLSQWEETFRVNVNSIFLTTRAFLPDMIHAKTGCIINLSSIWGMVGGSCETDYSAAKGAVIAFTKALAKETGPSGIRVNCVAPGVIDTRMNGHLTQEEMGQLKEETPLERIGTPEEVAALIHFLASEKAEFLTGQVISPNGGIVI